MSCELVCTGWYSTDAPRSYVTFGDDGIRNNVFRPLWWQSIDTFVKPQHVLIVDSASPVKPQDASYTSTNYQYIEMLRNPGHSQNCTTHYAGYMASVILGLEYALLNDVDFFLYIEQDALTYGKDFVKKIKQSLLKSDFVFGNAGARSEIEQSVFALSKKGIRNFLSALHAIEYSDRQVPPEMKFMYAASHLNGTPLDGLLSWDNPLWVRRPFTRLFFQLMPLFGQYTLLPFGYGRVRPINFDDDIFYFQQGTKEEINLYKQRTGF
jgi:hypothetical protein